MKGLPFIQMVGAKQGGICQTQVSGKNTVEP